MKLSAGCAAGPRPPARPGRCVCLGRAALLAATLSVRSDASGAASDAAAVRKEL